MGKVLWINPSFLDYRIPLYKELYLKLSREFHLLYSKSRIPTRVHNHIVNELGTNAHYIEKEKIFKFGSKSSEFANSSISIPFPSGLYSEIKKIKPNAIIAEGYFQFTPWAVVYCALHRIPLYIAYERTAHTERNCPKWRKLYRKFIGLFVKGYIANGQLTKEYLISQRVKTQNIQTGGMCADSKYLRINCNNMSTHEREAFGDKIGLKIINGLRFIYVGRIISLKGVNYLLDAWKKHIYTFPDDEIIIVGDGELLNEYRHIYGSVKSIKFLGNVDYSEIFKYYAISDVFIIPTLEDNWSLVVPEAMACGLPIACSIYNGCHPELVKEGLNGFKFDPLKQESIIECLKKFHFANLKEFSDFSSKLEEKYSPENTADNILKLLR